MVLGEFAVDVKLCIGKTFVAFARQEVSDFAAQNFRAYQLYTLSAGEESQS